MLEFGAYLVPNRAWLHSPLLNSARKMLGYAAVRRHLLVRTWSILSIQGWPHARQLVCCQSGVCEGREIGTAELRRDRKLFIRRSQARLQTFVFLPKSALWSLLLRWDFVCNRPLSKVLIWSPNWGVKGFCLSLDWSITCLDVDWDNQLHLVPCSNWSVSKAILLGITFDGCLSDCFRFITWMEFLYYASLDCAWLC